MRKRIFALLLVFLLFAGITPLWAATDPVSLIENSSYSEEDKEYLRIQVDSLIKEAQEKDLPLSPIVSKLKEGLNKKVLPYELVKTLNVKKDSLERAQKILEENGVKGEEDLVIDLALSFELSVPPQVVEEAVNKALANDGERLQVAVDSLSSFIEMGVEPEKAGEIVGKAVEKGFSARDMKEMTDLVIKARRAGADPQRVAETLTNALGKYSNFKLVEREVERVIASSREKPALKSGEGVVVSSPGITGSTPVQEGGSPLESDVPSSGGKPPTEEGGTAPETASPSGKPPLQEGGGPLDQSP